MGSYDSVDRWRGHGYNASVGVPSGYDKPASILTGLGALMFITGLCWSSFWCWFFWAYFLNSQKVFFA